MADGKTVQNLYHREGCTMQVIQPQRFDDRLWRLVAAMESQFGCLVGSNAYLTPKGERSGCRRCCYLVVKVLVVVGPMLLSKIAVVYIY